MLEASLAGNDPLLGPAQYFAVDMTELVWNKPLVKYEMCSVPVSVLVWVEDRYTSAIGSRMFAGHVVSSTPITDAPIPYEHSSLVYVCVWRRCL